MSYFRMCCLAGAAALSLMAQPGPPPPGGDWAAFGPGGRFAMMGLGFGMGIGQTVPGAPYSALQTSQTVQKLADGNTIQRTDQANVYRDAQGRVRVEHNFSRQGTPARMINIFDPVGGYSYLLDPSAKTALKSPVMGPPAGAPGFGRHRNTSSGGSQTQTENLGTQTINGLAATGQRTTQTISAGAIGNAQPIQVVREVWMSPELKVPVMIKASDPRFGETVMQLTNIVQGPPDPSLFQVPAGYAVQTGPGRGMGMGRMRGPGR